MSLRIIRIDYEGKRSAGRLMCAAAANGRIVYERATAITGRAEDGSMGESRGEQPGYAARRKEIREGHPKAD